MNKFIYKIPYDIFITQPINEIFEYMGIIIKINTNIINNNIGLFYNVKIPFGYENILIHFKYGLINNKDIYLLKYQLKYSFLYNNNDYIGNEKFITLDKIEKYKINNNIILFIEIIDTDLSNHNINLLQKIYYKLFKNESDNLIHTLQCENQQLLEINKELYDKNKINTDKQFRLKDNNLNYQLIQLKHELLQKNNTIIEYQKIIDTLHLELNDKKKELDLLTSNTNINKYININNLIDTNDFNHTIINNNIDDKYYINIINLDKINIHQFNLYDLKIVNNKLQKLNILITDKLNELDSCSICYANSKNCILIPCGHKICCFQCSINLKNKCPICRNNFENIIKIFE